MILKISFNKNDSIILWFQPHLGLNPTSWQEIQIQFQTQTQTGVTHVYPQLLTSKQKDKDCPDPTMTQRSSMSVKSHCLSRSAFNLYYTDVEWEPAHGVSVNHVHMI